MEISCTLNSGAYKRVLQLPWQYVFNWETLTTGDKNAACSAFIEELSLINQVQSTNDGTFIMSSDLAPSSAPHENATPPADPQAQEEPQVNSNLSFYSALLSTIPSLFCISG